MLLQLALTASYTHFDNQIPDRQDFLLEHAVGALPMSTARIQSRSRAHRRSELQQWRLRIRREVTWLLTMKFVALALLWLLFFSPAQRRHVDGEAVSRQLGIDRSTLVIGLKHQGERP